MTTTDNAAQLPPDASAFAEEHATIEKAEERIESAQERIHARLAQVPMPPGAAPLRGVFDEAEWVYSKSRGLYARDVAMRRWSLPAGERGREIEIALFVTQLETGELCDWVIDLDDVSLNVDEARQLAAVLTEATATIDSKAGSR